MGIDQAVRLGAAALRYIRSRLTVSQDVRVEHRPMVRVVAAERQQFGFFGPGVTQSGNSMTRQLDPAAVILKNESGAAAFAVVIFDPENAAIMACVPAVSPLGQGTDEAHRIGRTPVGLSRPLQIGSDYELYCQDRFGSWHLTKFHVGIRALRCAAFSVRHRQSANTRG